MTAPTENPNVTDDPIFDPFPEPNTMPSGWDLSDITHDPGRRPPRQNTAGSRIQKGLSARVNRGERTLISIQENHYAKNFIRKSLGFARCDPTTRYPGRPLH